MLNETIDISQLGNRVNKAADNMIFAGVVALTRVAKIGQRAVQDILPDTFNIRNKWTIQGVKITPATMQSQEAEVYSKDWYMPIHEQGGQRQPKSVFWVPVGIREALGISKKELIPVSMRHKNILKGRKKINGNRPFLQVNKAGKIGIYVRDDIKSIKLLYRYHAQPIKIPQRKWFYDEVNTAYDSHLESEYNQALLQAWSGNW
jgi:hypothetical protein